MWEDVQVYEVHNHSENQCFAVSTYIVESWANGQMDTGSLLTDYPGMALVYKTLYGN
jgi:hypothetical protein